MDSLKIKTSSENPSNFNEHKNQFHKNKIVKSNLKNAKNLTFKANSRRILQLREGDKVWYLSSLQGKVFRYEGTVVEKISDLRYKVSINGNVKVCHINQLERKFDRTKYFEISNNDFPHQKPRQIVKPTKQVTEKGNKRLRIKSKTDSTDTEERPERPVREKKKPNWYNPSQWFNKSIY
jgi:hypothetical protein